MVFGEVEFLKPESGDLIQDRSLIRNGIGENNVESGKTIADNEEEGIAEIEHFAHSSAAQFFDSGELITDCAVVCMDGIVRSG